MRVGYTILERLAGDTDGWVFRDQKCGQKLCVAMPDGYTTDCRENATRACYWETSFNVSQQAIESGAAFVQSGFARGNFNYRLGLDRGDFVGTGLRIL